MVNQARIGISIVKPITFQKNSPTLHPSFAQCKITVILTHIAYLKINIYPIVKTATSTIAWLRYPGRFDHLNFDMLTSRFIGVWICLVPMYRDRASDLGFPRPPGGAIVQAGLVLSAVKSRLAPGCFFSVAQKSVLISEIRG